MRQFGRRLRKPHVAGKNVTTRLGCAVFKNITPIPENSIEKNMEHERKLGIRRDYIRFRVYLPPASNA